MQTQASFDPDLVRRYSRNAPRYASYPTAAQFSSDFDVLAYRRAAFLSNADPSKPLAAHVNIPFQAIPSFYSSHSDVVKPARNLARNYLEHLKAEMDLHSNLFDSRRRLRQLHLGGGAPTYMSTEQLEELIGHLNRCFEPDVLALREYSIDIEPATLTANTLPSLKLLGFNHVSLAVLDFDPVVQRAMSRYQSLEQTRATVAQTRQCGFSSINFDLVYGLPQQSISSFRTTLESVIDLRPDRIAVHGHPHFSRLFRVHVGRERDLPAQAVRAQLLQLTVEMLTDAGYTYLGLDHFASQKDALSAAWRAGSLHRNFHGYSTQIERDLIGIGVGATGKLGNTYSQNARQLQDYYDALDHDTLPIERGVELTIDDLTRRDIIERILCKGEVDIKEIEDFYALDFKTYFAAELGELKQMQKDGLLSELSDRLVVGPKGQVLLRSIAMVFDAYFRATSANNLSRAG